MARHHVYFVIKATKEVKESVIVSSLGHVESQIMQQKLLLEGIYGPVEVSNIVTEIASPEIALGITSKGEPAVNGMRAEIAAGPDGRILLVTEDRVYTTDVMTFWTTYRQGVHPDLSYVEQLEKTIAYYRRELEWLINYVDNPPPGASQVKIMYNIRDVVREMLDGPNR